MLSLLTRLNKCVFASASPTWDDLGMGLRQVFMNKNGFFLVFLFCFLTDFTGSALD
jgi:hypothetical protein